MQFYGVSEEKLKLIPKTPLRQAMARDTFLRIAVEKLEGIYDHDLKANPLVLHHNPFPGRLAQGVSLGDQYIYLGDEDKFRTHELTHLFDFELNYMGCANQPKDSLLGRLKEALLNIVLDGRAVFATMIANKRLETAPKTSFKTMVDVWKRANPTGLDPIVTVATCLYYLATNALVKLAKRINDQIQAFRMATEKPMGIIGVLFPEFYYRKEIKEHEERN